jgi:hypothetical protein
MNVVSFPDASVFPLLGNHRAAVGAAGVEDRIGPPDGVMHLRRDQEVAADSKPSLLAEPSSAADNRLS